MVLDSMAGSTIYSAINLTDGFYQILMRATDIFVYSRASDGASDLEVHLAHLREVFATATNRG